MDRVKLIDKIFDIKLKQYNEELSLNKSQLSKKDFLLYERRLVLKNCEDIVKNGLNINNII